MVHAAVHSARTTLSGPREKGTFVSTQLVHYFVRIDGILGPWRRIDRSASSPGVTACDAVFAHVQQVASGTPHSASLSPRSTSDIDSYACDAVRCSGAANRSANGRRGMGGRTWRRHNRFMASQWAARHAQPRLDPSTCCRGRCLSMRAQRTPSCHSSAVHCTKRAAAADEWMFVSGGGPHARRVATTSPSRCRRRRRQATTVAATSVAAATASLRHRLHLYGGSCLRRAQRVQRHGRVARRAVPMRAPARVARGAAQQCDSGAVCCLRRTRHDDRACTRAARVGAVGPTPPHGRPTRGHEKAFRSPAGDPTHGSWRARARMARS